ncbi:hypothetical protein QBC41DRAFT_334824 [Cercophora samala]|uniref:Uncharacterized protein n=1 Tax=Cercophora samala TaxID=330535 RepID=A0AA39ZJ49_9PEZI|nr:hypothetical protein QBC41DRAFT_334824 [Cercophora samala]
MATISKQLPLFFDNQIELCSAEYDEAEIRKLESLPRYADIPELLGAQVDERRHQRDRYREEMVRQATESLPLLLPDAFREYFALQNMVDAGSGGDGEGGDEQDRKDVISVVSDDKGEGSYKAAERGLSQDEDVYSSQDEDMSETEGGSEGGSEGGLLDFAEGNTRLEGGTGKTRAAVSKQSKFDHVKEETIQAIFRSHTKPSSRMKELVTIKVCFGSLIWPSQT